MIIPHEASSSKMGSRHQEQNREGDKVQSGQYTTCWTGLLHVALLNIFFSFIFFDKFYVCVDFYYKLILINKFIKYNQINNPCYCDCLYIFAIIAFIFFSNDSNQLI